MSETEIQSTKMLKLVCIVIWSIVVALLVLVVVVVNKTKNATVVIEGNVTINYNTVLDSPQELTIDDYVERLQTIYTGENRLSISKIPYDTAKKLCLLIETYSSKYGLDMASAMTIVAVESAFRADVYNSKGKAYGLCQVTEPCLKEYNYYNSTDYSISELFFPAINLEVGFWYYNRILTHYNDHYNYICEEDNWTSLRDAYIAYNYGVTNFARLTDAGKDDLRSGKYPNTANTKACNYGAKAGDSYGPYKRLKRMYNIISS